MQEAWRASILEKTILESIGLHWRMQAILVEGGLVKTILEIVAERCQLRASHTHEGGLGKTIHEIVAVLYHLLASHHHGRWACEDHP